MLVCYLFNLINIDKNQSASLNLNIMNQLNQLDPHLHQQLSSLTNANWQTQVQIINSLPHNLQLIKLINHRNYSSDIASLLTAINPRSKVVTTVVDFIVGIFSLHCNQLYSFANLLVNEDCLLRLLGSGNKILSQVVSSAANEALKSIISNTDFKEKYKQIKYVYALQQQFLKSKNNYVREKISLYFQLIVASGYYHTKEALIDFEKKIVKPGLQDACQKVRKNMRKVLENAANFQKQNLIQNLQMEVASKHCYQIPKTLPKKYMIKGKARVVYSSVNQSSILEGFRQETENIASRSQKQPKSLAMNSQVSECNYKFYLERLKAGGTWPMVIIAYEEITNCITKGWLNTLSSDILYFQTIKQLMPFLTEKRSKIYENCCQVFVVLFNSVRENKTGKILTYLQEINNKLIEYIVKIQSVGVKLLPLLVQLMPWYYVVKIAEVSIELKVNRQKLLVLDCLLKCFSSLQEQNRQKSNKKVTAIVKTMCQHIISTNGKDRQINFAALAIISHLKSKYPEDVLTTLLCQSDKVLTKIIEMAESIDNNLKQAVIQYIASFKSQKNYSVSSKTSSKSQPHIGHIENELRLVMEGKTNSLNNLGYLYLTNLNRINEEYFKRLIKLLQYQNQRDVLMQLKIILTQIAKQPTLPFLKALISIMQYEKSDMSKQYHILMYIQILGVAMKSLNQKQQQVENIVEIMIKAYRKWQSLKIRNIAIQNLTAVEETILAKYANEKQFELIRVYRDHLFEEEDDSQDQHDQLESKEQHRAQIYELDYTE